MSYAKTKLAEDATSYKDKVIEELQSKLKESEDKNLEERFYWILGIVIFIDMFVFTHMESWGGPISILILELIGLIVLAEKCGVDIVAKIMDKIIDGWKNNNPTNG